MRAARVVPGQVSKVSNVSEHIYVPFKKHLKRLVPNMGGVSRFILSRNENLPPHRVLPPPPIGKRKAMRGQWRILYRERIICREHILVWGLVKCVK
jgi:hypothetical protein